MTFDLIGEILSSEYKSDCKGLIFRGYNKQFKTKAGFCQKIELRFMKRISCKGCLDCGGLMESVQMHLECDLNFLGFDKVEHDKYYTFRFINLSRDWESGLIDDYDIEIQEANFDSTS